MKLPVSSGRRGAMQRKRKTKGIQTDSPDFERIKALPRRDWETELYEGFTVEEVAEYLTQALKRPGGQMSLRPVQAKALQEAHDYGGMFAPIPVGNGKTLVSFLLPTLLKAQRPLLIVPAKLRDKTYREFSALMQHWAPHPNYEIVSYEKLSRTSGTELLLELDPDMLVFDEAHRVKNREAAVTRRLQQYIDARRPVVCAMSGTLIKRSLLDFAHIMRWSVPKGGAPLPYDHSELQMWADALDEIKFSEGRKPLDPTPILELAEDTPELSIGTNPREEARRVLRERFLATPTIISTSCPLEIEASLDIELHAIEGYNDRTLDLADGVNQGVKPNGEVIEDQDLSASWRIMRTLTSGFWYDFKEPPPPDWLSAKKGWQRIVRTYLEMHMPGLESPMAIAQKAIKGELPTGVPEYREWVAIRDTFKPVSVPRWVDDTMIHAVANWVQKHTGIIWVSEVALGERLSADLGLPYFRQMGKDAEGNPIEESSPKKGCIIASVASNSEGRNLQHWSDNLVISPPPTGSVWEQLLGRTHRPGQQADEVNFDVFIGCAVEWECFQQALRDARMGSDIENPKKLSAASITLCQRPMTNALWGL